MSFRDHICILKPRDETYTAPLDIVQKVLSESKLSKSELQKPAGKGPNSGIPRIEIFAKKVTNGEDHMLNDGTTVKVKEVTMNGETIYSQAQEEIEKLEELISVTNSPPMMFGMG